MSQLKIEYENTVGNDADNECFDCWWAVLEDDKLICKAESEEIAQRIVAALTQYTP